MKRLIIFDMDGTLVNSGPMIANTINHVRTNIGLFPLDQTTILTEVNNPHNNPSEFFYNTPHFTDEQTQLFETYYHKHCVEDVILYEGIEPLLKQLSKQNHELAVATNASTHFAHKILKHVNIHHYFSFIIGADKVKAPKPAPDMIVHILDYYKIDANHAIVIGDSPKDKIAANRANVEALLVNWGFSEHETGVIETIEELQQQLLPT
jgi:phosphoglycolate phosphatase